MREISHMFVYPEAATMKPVSGAPQLSAALCDMLREVEIVDEYAARRLIDVPAERALTILMDERELVTLMTLGASPELLVLGYLHNQRLIDNVAQVESITVDWNLGAASVRSRAAYRAVTTKTTSNIVTTGCGVGTVISGLLDHINTIRLPSTDAARIRQSVLYRLLEIVSAQDSLHRNSGSVHGCALFRGAEMLVFVEDVGRHNAIDTIIGWMALNGVDGGDKIFYTTGRLSGEMVIKSAQIGVPIVVSRNGVTAMGVEVASTLGMTLIGRAMKRRFLCCAGAERLDSEPESRSAAIEAAQI